MTYEKAKEIIKIAKLAAQMGLDPMDTVEKVEAAKKVGAK